MIAVTVMALTTIVGDYDMANVILEDIPNLLGATVTFSDPIPEKWGGGFTEVSGMIQGICVNHPIGSTVVEFFVNDNTYNFSDVVFSQESLKLFKNP